MRSTALRARRAKQSTARKSCSGSSKTHNDGQRPLTLLGCARGSKTRQRLRASLEGAASIGSRRSRNDHPGANTRLLSSARSPAPHSLMIGLPLRGSPACPITGSNLTSSFTATGPREWKVVGGDRVGTRSAAADLQRHRGWLSR